MRDDLANLLCVVTSPSRAFSRLTEHPKWLLPFLAVSIGSMVLAWLNLPLIEKVLLSSLPGDTRPDQMLTIYRVGQIIGIALTPAGILLNWFLTALLVWAVSYAFAKRAHFGRVFSLVGHCSLISFMGLVLSWVIIRARGTENVSSLADLDVSLGVTLLLDDNKIGGLARSVLSHASVFTAWYWIVLALGLAAILPSTRRTAAWIAGSAFIASVVLSAGASIVAEAMSGLGFPMQ